MSRLVVVSNRVSLPGDRSSSAGGLAVAMRDALQRQGGIWFGWSGKVVEGEAGPPHQVTAGGVTYVTVDLTRQDLDEYYNGFANSTLWPLFHYRPGLLELRRRTFEGYLRVNQSFAATLAPLLHPEDLIWVHDYHLIPLPRDLRKLGVANRIGFFLHTPLPASELLVILPAHRTLVQALCACDLVGFQASTDLRAFQDYIVYEGGGTVTPDSIIYAFGRQLRAGVFPIGIETDRFATMARTAASAPEVTRLNESLGGRALIIGVDRLDYSKGLVNRFEAFEALLAAWPQHRAHATLMQIAPISRGEVRNYRTLRRELEAAAGRVNGKYAEFDWVPIRYLNKGFSREILAGFYRGSRVGLVTPLRDGMNLVAKEYVAAQDPENPGVLVLSRFSGAARELDAAMIVNPFDIDQVAEAVHTALGMPLDERRARWEAMMAVLRRNTLSAWRTGFLDTLQDAGRAAA